MGGAIFFVFGMLGAMATIPFGYILQSETPQALMGRVSSVYGALESAAMFAAPSIGAALASCAMALLAVCVLVFYRRIYIEMQ